MMFEFLMSLLKLALYYWQAELSWGSIQAETVRLQRQIETDLMDIHLKFTEYPCVFVPKQFLGPKMDGSKKFREKICFGSNKF